VGVIKGQSGQAGELKGSFLKENEQIGTLALNSEYGIYGCMEERLLMRCIQGDCLSARAKWRILAGRPSCRPWTARA